ncbi:MAG: hypothetical protein BWK80_25730 [Desulfobacteraceae bacterium IS3]|nr:MAG: hypothetical protein BWK80_25730 [Desulfobacteraceae bacterium IS3]
MKTITIPEDEYLLMSQTIINLKKQLELLQDNSFMEKLSTAYRLFFQKEVSAETDTERISLKRGSGKRIITYIADDFNEPLEDFREYME